MQKQRVPFHLQTLIAMALGIGVGWVAGPAVAPLGKIGGALIQIIKALATPLLFLVLVDSFVRASIRGHTLFVLLVVCAINALFAVTIGMGLSNLFRPGDALRGLLPPAQKALEAPNLGSLLLGYVPDNLLDPFLKHSIPGVILLAILFGFALKNLKDSGVATQGATRALELTTQIVVQAVTWVVRFSPLAVFAVVAQSVGTHGFAQLAGLAGYLGCSIAGMAIQVLVVYQIWVAVIARIPLSRFWKEAYGPAAYSVGINSSLATLPLTFQALDRLKISPTASRVGAGLGTNFNNDGILLYEAMAVLLVAQAYGLELSWSTQLLLAASCVLTTFGVAGVPEAGIVALTLVLSSSGIPTEILPLLLTVDWIIARCRSATNVLGDMTVSIALDRFLNFNARHEKRRS